MVMWGAHGHPISTPDICGWCNPGINRLSAMALSRHESTSVFRSLSGQEWTSGKAARTTQLTHLRHRENSLRFSQIVLCRMGRLVQRHGFDTALVQGPVPAIAAPGLKIN